jgi:hypothetical protein
MKVLINFWARVTHTKQGKTDPFNLCSENLIANNSLQTSFIVRAQNAPMKFNALLDGSHHGLPNLSKMPGVAADSLSGIYNAMARCLFILHQSCIHKGLCSPPSPHPKYKSAAFKPGKGEEHGVGSALHTHRPWQVLPTSRTTWLKPAGAPSCSCWQRREQCGCLPDCLQLPRHLWTEEAVHVDTHQGALNLTAYILSTCYGFTLAAITHKLNIPDTC